jgi:adenosylmethionine-8-amino-7-oxononanoate aminotransferase
MGVSDGPTAIFHRSFTKQYDTASGGKGVYIFGPNGKRVLDGSSGAAVSCLGHGHTTVIEAIVQQARNMAYVHSSFFTTAPAEELAQLMCSRSNGAFSKLLVLCSGTNKIFHECLLGITHRLDRIGSSRVSHQNCPTVSLQPG